MRTFEKEVTVVTGLLVIAFIVLVGPLAALIGVDSRLDDPRRGWPGTRSPKD